MKGSASMSSGPIEVARARKTTQSVYSKAVVDECEELFGNDSIEYGLAIAGLPQLIKLLSTHLQRFRPEAILMVANVNDPNRSGIIAAAERAVQIANLKQSAEPAADRAPTPSWFS